MWHLGERPNNVGWSRSLFTTFHLGRCSEHLSSEPSFPTRPSTSHAPHKTISQNPPKFPVSLSVQNLGYIAISPHIIVQERMFPITLDHGEIQERAQVLIIQVKSRSAKQHLTKKSFAALESARAKTITAAVHGLIPYYRQRVSALTITPRMA